MQSRWMIRTGISQRSAKKPPDEGGQHRRKWLSPSGCRSLSGRIRGEFVRTVGRRTGAPERLVSRSGAPWVAFFGVVFACSALKAAAGTKTFPETFCDSFPPEARKRRCQSTNVCACRGRPQSTDKGGDKAGEGKGKGTEGAEGRRKPPNAKTREAQASQQGRQKLPSDDTREAQASQKGSPKT